MRERKTDRERDCASNWRPARSEAFMAAAVEIGQNRKKCAETQLTNWRNCFSILKSLVGKMRQVGREATPEFIGSATS